MDKVTEACVVLSRCGGNRKLFGIRVEKRISDAWYCTWAFPISEKSASNEGYGGVMVSGVVNFDDEYPGCPYCGSDGWVKCSDCGKLTCLVNDNSFTCSWCGKSGSLNFTDKFDLSGNGY